MCFSMEMSYGISVAAIGSAVYIAKQGAPKRAWVPIVFFASMEALQGTQYIWVDQCGEFANKFMVYLAWLHICFQPLFFNMWISYFIPDKEKSDYYMKLMTKLCLIAGLLLAARALPFPHLCKAGEGLFCDLVACAYSGNLHIAWHIPLAETGIYQMRPGMFIHFFLFFIPAIVAGRYWISLFVYLTGPVLSSFMTDDINEMPVIWCFFSTVQMLITYRYMLSKKKVSDENGGALDFEDKAKEQGVTASQ